jgi:formylglycine-generating enzyme required for sulfatase activity
MRPKFSIFLFEILFLIPIFFLQKFTNTSVNNFNLLAHTITKSDIKEIGSIKFMIIPSGSFMMGSVEGEGEKDEHPQHKVTLDSFWIGIYEVTQKQYQDIMGRNPSYFKGENLPVEQVTWDDAQEFCKKFSEKYNVKMRLPTEAEWEYACRAGATSQYYWGKELDGDYCWYKKNSGDITHPVGEKKPNAWGLYDMAGNIWEWCMDWYNDRYYMISPANNPKG